MQLHNTTSVPNQVIDEHIMKLQLAELRILLVVIRQTLGWGKEKDWIAGKQMQAKTGSSPRAINSALQVLENRDLIEIQDEQGQRLSPRDRQGRQRLYFKLSEKILQNVQKPPQNQTSSSAKGNSNPTQDLRTTKDTVTKNTFTRGFLDRMKREVAAAGGFETFLQQVKAVRRDASGNRTVIHYPDLREYFIRIGWEPPEGLGDEPAYKVWERARECLKTQELQA